VVNLAYRAPPLREEMLPPLMRLPDPGVILVDISKNASNSLKAALRAADRRWQAIGRRQMRRHPDEPKIAMWRDPRLRLESAYRMFFEQGRTSGPFAEWALEVCLYPGSDKHLAPQAGFCVFDGRWFVDRVLRWDFDGFRRVFQTGPVERLNESDSAVECAWSREAEEAFAVRYADDIAVWEGRERI
jgi:hypothetical protein